MLGDIDFLYEVIGLFAADLNAALRAAANRRHPWTKHTQLTKNLSDNEG